MTPNVDPRVDHYKVLGVSSEASADEIKKAYRRLAKKYHPDSTGGDKKAEAKFKEISTAYDVLGDADKRAEYDALRAGGRAGFGGPGGFGGAGAGAGIDLGDLFSQMFSGGGGAPGGGNVRYHVHTGGGGDPFGGGDFFSDDIFGGAARSRRRRSARTAREPSERKVRAPDGAVLTQRGSDVHSELRVPLDQAVLGTVASVSTVTGKANVKIPPGTSSGVKLRLKGKGAEGPRGRGDHFATVHIDVPKKIDDEARKLLVQFMERARTSGGRS